jgi:hypothetical protein
VIPLQLNREFDGTLLVIAELLRTWFLLLVTYAVQLLFLYEIAQIDEAKKWEVNTELRSLNLVCVFIFMVQIFQEFHACKDLFHVLIKCPHKHSERSVYQQLMPRPCTDIASPRNHEQQHGAILEEETSPAKRAADQCAAFYVMNHMTSYMKKLYPGKAPEDVFILWTLDDMTLGWKFCCIVFAAIPRFIICLLCGYIGAIYIGRSESKEAMLLNTLAVLFVLDIDESIYNVFTSGSLKVHMENVKPIVLHPTNNERLISFVFASFIFPVLVVALSWLIVDLDMNNELDVSWLGKLGIGHLVDRSDD